ncbi:putative long chain acyl-CoA synthase [Jatrophihabitans endophyticus]|uniref:Putative long chain acyl-CoA synthase n=1 Tax=Jatrophihabitans endophyticus TaxID=1206085 RepID=A0A1M5GG52_9ACTN|nr:alpha/beta fold hydrolase [Jatrophihabitans endophyticus]SHG02760.1 putative long chain acyl-CoA synthase [Jatrophihabitans endophyticus]
MTTSDERTDELAPSTGTTEPTRRGGGRGIVGMPAAAARYASRVRHTARNVAEVVRFGGLETDEENSPFDVAAERTTYRLRHYFAASVPADATPILLIPPLMMTAEVWDVSPTTSAVAALHEAGIDPWVVDFGRPDHEPGGLQRTLTDHVLAVSDAVDRVVAATGRKVVLSGYSQGGMFAYQTAAYRRGKDVDSIVAFGSPVDTTAPLPIPIAPDVAARLAREIVDSGLLRNRAVPGWFVRLGFKALSPAKTVQGRMHFLMQLHDRDALLPREKQRQFLDSAGWTAYSGPAIAELLEQFVAHNRMLEGGFDIDDELVTLADIDVPVLTVVGSSDTFGHPDSARAIRRAAPRAEVYEVTINAGHFGLVVGSNATTITWPAVSAWIDWRRGRAPLPDDIVMADTVDTSKPLRPTTAATAIAQATELGIGVGRAVFTSARRASRLARSIAREAPAQLPKIARIQQLEPATRISLGLLLDEQARRAPSDIAFLFGDRAHRQWDVKARVDNVVRGLVSIGVHQGDHVAVLMDTRPSAFTLIAAISRLGATAVLLRPDSDVVREIRLGGATWVVSDPEHAGASDEVDGVTWAVLGGGGPAGGDATARPDLPDGVVDMELIDPDEVVLPAWYGANPHRAGDVAFVLFTGEGGGTKALHITNRRWALSALGTASAASLRPGDTIFSTTPIHHSSALLMTIGGAVAGGARFAIASADDPDTFWQEVRRYGATHVSYTWTSLRTVVNAPPNPAEHHHPVRMFIGSGMPRNLWRRATERFPTVTVLEFYASAEGEAILANVTGRTPGSMGRSLPGTAEVRVAGFDLQANRLQRDENGLGREAEVDELGLLLARVDPRDSFAGVPLRGVFEAGDAWRSTGDLFLRDENGDLWLGGAVAEVVHTAAGPAIPSGARFALGSIPAVDLVVAYGVHDADRGSDVLVAAVTLREDAEALTAADLDRVLDKLPVVMRPRYVQVVPTIPLTTWHRPHWRTLQAKGVPRPGRGRRVWALAADDVHYEQVT